MAYENDNERGLLYRIANFFGTGPGIAGTAGAAAGTPGTIATSGGTADVVFTAATRTEIINPSATTLWARWSGTPTVNGAGSFPIVANGSFAPGYGVTGTLTLLSTAANQPYTVNRVS